MTRTVYDTEDGEPLYEIEYDPDDPELEDPEVDVRGIIADTDEE